MKKTKNTILIVFLCITLFLGGILLLFNIGTSDNNVNIIVSNINYTKFIKDSKRINTILNSKRIPIEIFDYIDEDKIIKLIENNTFNKEKITKILVESINKYEDEHEVSIYEYSTEEIDEVSSIINSKIKEMYTIYEGIVFLSNSRHLFLVTALLLTIILTIKKEFVSIGVSYITIAIISYYTLRTYFSYSLNRLIGFNIDKIIIDNLTKAYTIYLCTGIIFLLIKIIISIKEIFDKSKNWR